MDANLLVKLFGQDGGWRGACTVVLNADATVNITGPDSLGTGGTKYYAPRLASGRVQADAVCLLPKESALLIVQRHRNRMNTGEHKVEQKVTIADFDHIAAVEFPDLDVLAWLGVDPPPEAVNEDYQPGALIG